MDLYRRRVLRLRNHVLSQGNDPSEQPRKRDCKDTNTVSRPESQKPADKSLGPIDMSSLTKDEIMTVLDNEGIEYSSRDRKEDLFNLIP